MSQYPRIFRVRQVFERCCIEDVSAAVDSELARLALHRRVRPGQSVAITAGSRGIANIPIILRAVVRHVRGIGAEPFIVPAMGSHGGGTAEGQRKVLAAYGITESFCGCPIRAGMETVVVCRAAEGFPVHFDQHAYQADHVLVCGRVKPHTRFVGEIESGLMKMLLIGLGKHAGATVYHRAIQDFSFGQIVRSVAREVLTRCRILAGLAIVENAYDETAKIAAVAPEEFEVREKELLCLARQWMPKLPFDAADVLLIDRIGKDISGTGLDTNVVGRKFLDHAARDDELPKIRFLVVRGLSPASCGNGTGLGLVEFCRSRVLREMDLPATRINCLTGGHLTAAMLPLDYETDREILDTAFAGIGLTEPPAARLLWIQDTLKPADVECSEAFLAAAKGRNDLEILTDPRPLPLGHDGNLPDQSELSIDRR
ncbi:MAG: DUF2088 domain-containing protein [Planctomycetes bacterium]|nr:DUF2088 domain-containing protein [Planctomycetota bacterium]